MNTNEFYNIVKLIAKHKNKIALININEFRRLKRTQGEYKGVPFEIGSMPAIPIKTTDFKEAYKATSEMVKIRLTPIWNYITNGKQVIAPNIESFELTEHSKFKPHYKLSRIINPNHHYLTNLKTLNIFDQEIAKEENAIEWEKIPSSPLLAPVDERILQLFLQKYKDELDEFNKIYEESAQTAKELSNFQKKLK